MKCPTCGTELPENTKFCTFCGTAMETVAPARPAPTRPVSAAPAAPAPMAPAPETKLLGPWAYFGLQLLFSIPLVGFILLIVFSFDNSNLNRRNYARSYWCALIVGLVVAIVFGIIFAITGAGAAIVSQMG